MTRLGHRVRRLFGSEPVRCSHLDQARDVKALSDGCGVCLATGGTWVEIRLCLTCGNVGCCDLSPGRHARAHFTETGHPLIRAELPGYTWCWCWIDEVKV